MSARRLVLILSNASFAVAITATHGLGQPDISFRAGHIYLSISESEPCDQGGMGREWIVEINPWTGARTIFADSDDGICAISGLIFSRDGRRLLLINSGHVSPFDGGWIQSFSPDGTSEIILDETDGFLRPRGSNGIAFDRNGDLFVVSASDSKIIRFPKGQGPGIVFADSSDGIVGRGGLAFAPNGDLFYGSGATNKILRITPTGGL